jgi:hypothetical protein
MPSSVTGDFAYDLGVRGALPIVVALAACEPSGLTLEITTSNHNVTSVEVLVGMDCTGDCPRRIAPPALAPRPIDQIFVVDGDGPWSATVEGGVAGFRLATDSRTEVDLVLAIGLDSAGQPIETAYAYDVVVPVNRGEYVRVPLEAVTPVAASLTAPPPADGTESLAIWREPVAKRACVLAEHWSGGSAPQRDLVVPVDDPDCDEVVNECAPWTHLAMNVPTTIDGADCSFVGALTSTADVCMLGGTPCNEIAATPGGPCGALDEPYCAPVVLCSACPGPWSPECAFTALYSGATMNTMPYLNCTFAIDNVGKPCIDEAIVTDVDGSALLGPQPTASCTSARVHDLALPLGPFQSSIPTEVGELRVDRVGTPCTVDVRFKGTAQPTESTAIALVDLDLDNDTHLALPAVIHITTGCTFQSACSFVVGTTSDPMLACAQQAPATAAVCGRTSGCLQGPACGATCCGVGEECVGGQCSCGSDPPCGPGDTCIAATARPDQCGTVCCGATPCPF